jgi:hypothetical protein
MAGSGAARSKMLPVIAITARTSGKWHGLAHGVRCAIQAREIAMNTTRNGIVGAICFVLLAAPSTAFAEFKPSAALRSACMADVFKLCSASLPSMDSVHACLKAKKLQASAKCQAQYDAEMKTTVQK